MRKLLSIMFLFNFFYVFAQDVSHTDSDSHIYGETISMNTNADTGLFIENVLKHNENEAFTSMILKDRLATLNAKTPFDVPYNATVERFIRLYLRDNKAFISNLMDRANYYFPMFEEQLDGHNIPLELKYLAVVESALLPTAKSHAGAKGIWQFMYHTGKEYGLTISSYVDERNDPLKATQAACRYLKNLYGRFNDWDLALAAYNSGPGNVNKAIRRSGGKRNYWNIRQYLPKETSSYVPAFYAMLYIFEYSKAHQIYPNDTEIDYFDTDTIHVKEKLSFSQIEKRTGVSKKFLASLNPQYKLGVIPYQKEKRFVLTLPKSAVEKFLDNELVGKNTLGNKEKPTHIIPTVYNSYVVQKLDNLPKIARKFGITLQQLKKWNGLHTDFLIEGQRLVITNKKNEVAMRPTIQKVHKQQSTSKPKVYEIYTVNEGDSLFIISKKFPNVTINQLRNWNNIWGVPHIKPGTELKILTSTE